MPFYIKAVYSGITNQASNSTSFLKIGVNWYTMTPARYFFARWNGASVFSIDESNYIVYLNYRIVDNAEYLRPVINLKANLEITDTTQDGTINKPYVIKIN